MSKVVLPKFGEAGGFAEWDEFKAAVRASAEGGNSATVAEVVAAAKEGLMEALSTTRRGDIQEEAQGLLQDLREQFIREWGAENCEDYNLPTPTPSPDDLKIFNIG
jgi:hypothetical protein